MLFRPWEHREDPFYVSDGSLDTFPFSKRLFVQTQCYNVEYAYLREGGQLRYQLTFREQPAELGELKLAGDFIQRLRLHGSPNHGLDVETGLPVGVAEAEPCTVVLEEPAKMVLVPVGRYDKQGVRLGKGNVVADLSDRTGRKSVIVAKDKLAALAVGGPLTNTVTMRQRGRDLVLDYELLGVGGSSYRLSQRGAPGGEKRPQFTVYQGDEKIASGEFRFG